MDKKFASQAANESAENYNKLSSREFPLYNRAGDVRSDFSRDYTRILHSNAFRRLKHKTQVFFNIENDHICTRMEHVLHVESVSSTIANALGLNTELTRAIALGHDLGHAPFGHQGEVVIDSITKKLINPNNSFWHEKNGLRFVDDIELLENNKKDRMNLNLTYAVRDGIICHCGEVDENGLKPRNEYLDLELINEKGAFQPSTWEGCVVKIADKIAYLGRDIEDACSLGFLTQEEISMLNDFCDNKDGEEVNTTSLIFDMISDICANSNPECGICLSADAAKRLDSIKKYNYEYIYKSSRLDTYKKYSDQIITSIFDTLFERYSGEKTIIKLGELGMFYPRLIGDFTKWLSTYCENDMPGMINNRPEKYQNKKIYMKLDSKEMYAQSIIDFISGMTDRYAVDVFNELVSYNSSIF